MSFGLEHSQYVGQANGFYNGELCGQAMGLTDGETHVRDGAQTFISVWDTSKNTVGGTVAGTVKLPLVLGGTYNFTVNWGDGTKLQKVQSFSAATATHVYARNGIYTVRINGQIDGWQFNNTGDRNKLIDVIKWGCLRLDSYGLSITNFFNGCDNLNLDMVNDVLPLTNLQFLFGMFEDTPATTTLLSTANRMNEWDVSNVSDFSNMFLNNENFNTYIPDWNTGNAIFFSSMFQGCFAFNQPIGNWDTSKLVLAGAMFNNATAFNQPLSGWNTSACTNMGIMFNNATNFNNGLASADTGTWIWDTSSCTNMASMFNSAIAFNQNINSWNVSNVTSMSDMFSNAVSFNQPLDGWNTSANTLTTNMFRTASVFNQNLSTWDTSKVTNMAAMFQQGTNFNNGFASGATGTLFWNTSACTDMNNMFQLARAFNQDVGGWNTSNVTNMSGMFGAASVFNQNLNSWDVSKVTSMLGMFSNTNNFNQPLSSWNTSACTSMNTMFNGSKLFNQNINSWDVSKVTNMNDMFNGANTFNQPLSGWNPSSLTSSTQMFNGSTVFNQNINSWDVSKLVDMSNMFVVTTVFNSPLSGWNTSACTTMNGTFSGTLAFNQPIGTWNVSRVNSAQNLFRNTVVFNQDLSNWNLSRASLLNNMFQFSKAFNSPLSGWSISANCTGMFSGALVFNQNINSWNVSGVTNMSQMFSGATAFNQPLSGWNVGRVTTMSEMFHTATAFNQNIGAWNVSACTNFTSFMLNKNPLTFSATNLDAIYNGWTNRARLQNGQTITFGSANYSSAATQSRQLLTRPNSGITLTSAVNNGSGLIRVTSSVAHALSGNNKVHITGVTGTVEANGPWHVNVVSATQVDLQGSTFTNAYISGGNMKVGYGWTITDGGVNGLMSSNIACSYTLNSVLTDAAGICPLATQTGVDFVLGVTGNAARFNALNDRIDIVNNANFSFTNGTNDIPFSISLWAYFTGFSSTGNFLFNKRGGTTGTDEWHIVYDQTTSQLQFLKIDKTNNTIFQGINAIGTPIALNNWYNITVTDDGSETEAGMKIYVNGVLQTPVSTSIGVYTGMPLGTNLTRMGQVSFGALTLATSHQGYLEDVSIWRYRVLSQADVTFLYNSGAGRTYPFP